VSPAVSRLDSLLNLLVEAIVRELESETRNENAPAALFDGTARGVRTRHDDDITARFG
jgi:hypothetical protein